VAHAPIRFLNSDRRIIQSGPEALVRGYGDIAKRVDAE
jgi:hypothetical protein